MLMKCFICNVVESADFALSSCKVCRNVVYCSRVCQRENWKEHKQICKSLVAGASGSMQVKHSNHTARCTSTNGLYECLRNVLSEDEDFTQLLKLFRESKPGGRTAAAHEMKQIALRQTEKRLHSWLLAALPELVHVDVDRLTWPSSPLLVMLECMDSTALSVDNRHSVYLAWLTELLYPDDHRAYVNQLIIAKQLVEHAVNVNDELWQSGTTPLHSACSSNVVTNLGFIYLLLENGANPNSRNQLGETPLMCAIKWAPGAAKVLIGWPMTNVNIVDESGRTVLDLVRMVIEELSDEVNSLENPRRAEDQFVLQQWREVEEMLMEKGGQ
jgi:hypothetical protein